MLSNTASHSEHKKENRIARTKKVMSKVYIQIDVSTTGSVPYPIQCILAVTRTMSIKLHKAITVNGKEYPAGSTVPWYMVYPFFIIHMGMFGASGFLMAYGMDEAGGFLFLHGGIAITVYLAFYYAMFGPEPLRWLLIDSVLGVFGIIAQLSWILAAFDKSMSDYPFERHIIPAIYYVLYTFLLHRAILDFGNGGGDPARAAMLNRFYFVASVLIYGVMLMS